MPTYDYKCPACKITIQHQHKMNDPAEILCDECLKNGKKSVMVKGFGGGLGFHFKGSGFYETDYKNK